MRRGRLGLRARACEDWCAPAQLADVVFEQIEREIDAAQQVLWDGLDSDSVMTRMRAAAYILRHTEAGRRRGWGRRRTRCRETAEPQDVTIKWID